MPDLFELALNAHGGLDRWRQVQSLDVRISLTGGLYRLKGYPDGVPNTLMHVETRRIAVDVSPWIGMGTVGHFVPDRVWITDGERRVIDDRSDPRASFAGHTRETPWDQLHRLYFTSYAMWNYLNTPFLFTLPGFEVKERSNPTRKTAKAGDVCGSNSRLTFLLTTGSKPAANKRSSLMKRGFCSGSITWPSVQPPTIASITRPSEGLSSPHFAGSSAGHHPGRA